MVLVLNYCIFNDFSETDTKKLSLAALLHDVGLTKISQKITGAKRKLSEQEFVEYKTHPALGHDLIKENAHIDPSVSKGVLQHHERLDGQGYPRGISNVSFEGLLIGMVDCFDSLTNSEKTHRKKKEPFGALKTIQDEILTQGKFDKNIFKELCLSLYGKGKYS
jgi:HD-GYP domain-containing protein (c-di-GMP phosphodiesterase class II)